MSAATELDALAWLPQIELAVALAAWAITLIGLLRHLAATGSMRPR